MSAGLLLSIVYIELCVYLLLSIAFSGVTAEYEVASKIIPPISLRVKHESGLDCGRIIFVLLTVLNTHG